MLKVKLEEKIATLEMCPTTRTRKVRFQQNSKESIGALETLDTKCGQPWDREPDLSLKPLMDIQS